MTTEPAFPTVSASVHLPHHGISIRDYFAAAALTGILSNPENAGLGTCDPRSTLLESYNFADHALSVREPKPDVAGLESYKRVTALLA